MQFVILQILAEWSMALAWPLETLESLRPNDSIAT